MFICLFRLWVITAIDHCKEQLSLLINKYFPQVDFRCIFVNKNIVSSFFPFNPFSHSGHCIGPSSKISILV